MSIPLSLLEDYSSHLPPLIGIRSPPSSLLPLAAWRSLRESLYRCTQREIATWVVADIIWSSRSLQTPFLAKDDPFVPPTMLAATSPGRSGRYLPYRGAQAFHREGGEFIVTLVDRHFVEGHLSWSGCACAPCFV